MSARIFYTLGLMCAVLACAGVRAADGDKAKGGPGGRQVQILLDHADDLGLTAEQKAKLAEFAKGPLSVLTDEQKTKAREYMKAGNAAAGEKGERKAKKEAAAAEAKKPEEKKTEEKKPEEKKADEVK